jgi:hypothetical protein
MSLGHVGFRWILGVEPLWPIATVVLVVEVGFGLVCELEGF